MRGRFKSVLHRLEGKMIIELDRKRSEVKNVNLLRIGNNSKDIERYRDITVIYNVTHVVPCGDGWYDIYRGKTLLGHVTDVESVQEKW